jgi:predicted nucleotide-binding protein
MQASMKVMLVNEILSALESPDNFPLTPIVRKAVRLAELCDEPEYRLLFQHHIDGIAKERSLRTSVQRWSDPSRLPKWDLIKAWMDDRAIDAEAIQGLPLDQIENLVKTVQEGRKTSPNEGKALFKMELELASVLNRIRARVAKFVTIIQTQLEQDETDTNIMKAEKSRSPGNIFIGHGRSHCWQDLKDLLQSRLGLTPDEFNREPTPGITTIERLETMLDQAQFAFIVMTGEDEHTDGSVHARENVVHEAGLFQGRLGFRRAILLVEEGCAEFSNINGLTQIRFPKDDVLAKSEEIRRVLEREGVIPQE